jgi:hypothetical protein
VQREAQYIFSFLELRVIEKLGVFLVGKLLFEQKQAKATNESGTSEDGNQSYGYIIQIRYLFDGEILI